jgi:hypothetical protein
MDIDDYVMIIKALLSQMSALQDANDILKMVNEQKKESEHNEFSIGYEITRDAINKHMYPTKSKKRRGRPPGVKSKKVAPKKRGRPAKKKT